MSGLWGGDPTFLGWFTFMAYFVAALFAGRAGQACRFAGSPEKSGKSRRASGQGRLAAWWFVVAVMMLLLGLNKELDLQTTIAKLVRAAALDEGWYERRRGIQHAFVTGLMLLATGVAAAALYLLRGMWSRLALALTGVALVIAYALLRAAEFNVTGVAVPEPLASSPWLVELSGIALVLWSAYRTTHSSIHRRA